MPDESYKKTPLYEANRIMRQRTSKTFHDWARIRPAPFQDWVQGTKHASNNALTSTVTLEDFEDAVSSYLADKIKARDPDKLFPREARIELLKAELKNRGSTNKPDGYDRTANNAGYKFWAHNSFEFRPTTAFQFKSGLIQHPGFLYFKESEKSQKQIIRKWKKIYPKSEGPFLQAPVTSVENSYNDFLRAHIYRAQDENGNHYFVHRGRDETYAHLTMGISSSFPKKLVTDISWKCPTCLPRMIELSKAGKAREKERKKKRKAEHTGEETPTKKKQKKKKKKLAETSPSAETSPIQQLLEYTELRNSYYQQSAPEYLQNDFSDIYLLQSAQEYQDPEDNSTEYSSLLASSEPTPLSEAPQQNEPRDVRWVNYEGYPYYFLLCPPNHRLYLTTITMTYWGTVEIQRVGDSEKHTPDYYSLPAEISDIPLPPGIHFYNNPDHPIFIDPNTNTVVINCGRPIEPTAGTPSMQTMAGWSTDLEQVQSGDLTHAPATLYATESFQNPSTNPSNTNLGEVLAQDNRIYNIDLPLSSSSEVSAPSLADSYANQFEPLDKGLINPDDQILLGLNNFLSGTNYVPVTNSVLEQNMDFFNQALPLNADILDTNYVPDSDFVHENIMDLFDEQLLSNNDIPSTNSKVSDANLVDFETKDKETADAKPSPQCPISQPKVDASGRFSTLHEFNFPVPTSSRV